MLTPFASITLLVSFAIMFFSFQIKTLHQSNFIYQAFDQITQSLRTGNVPLRLSSSSHASGGVVWVNHQKEIYRGHTIPPLFFLTMHLKGQLSYEE